MRALPPMRLAYSILVGPILWFVHFVVVYAIAEFGCRANFNNLAFFTPGAIRIAVIVLTILAILAVGLGGLFAFQGWSALRGRAEQPGLEDRERFLLMLGLLFSALFVFIIAITGVPALVLDVCDQVV